VDLWTVGCASVDEAERSHRRQHQLWYMVSSSPYDPPVTGKFHRLVSVVEAESLELACRKASAFGGIGEQLHHVSQLPAHAKAAPAYRELNWLASTTYEAIWVER
jgi:hypothetical protein